MNIRKHKNLDKKLWDKNKSPYSPVRETLLAIVQAYVDNVRNMHHLDIRDSDIKDVFIYGSCANYFYTRKSDIDMCIVIDFKSIISQNSIADIEQILKMYWYNWAMAHNCLIMGRKIDVSIENVNNTISTNGRYRSGPVYSLLKNQWLFEPVIISDAEFKNIKKRAHLVFKKIMHDYNIVQRNGFQMADMQELYKNIYDSKNASHSENLEQPVNYMYIAFRKIRDCGIIDKLRKRAIDAESKNFILKKI